MVKIFKDILKDKDKWLQSEKGSEFEDRFESALKKDGYGRLLVCDYKKILSHIKKNILDKESTDFIENTFTSGDLKKAFFCQPYGSQQYSDFLVLTEKFIK